MRPIIFCFSVFAACVMQLHAAAGRDTNAAAPHVKDSLRTTRVINTNILQPTVTKEMGDAGGKFFGQLPDPAKTKHYYIAVEPELWDYVPEGRDVVCGRPLPPELVTGKRAMKLRYIQYTDETFTTAVMSDPRLGIMGPVLRGTVGQFLAVTLLNRVHRPVSMHPHGVRYDKDSEGAYYEPKPGLGAAIGQDARFTYVWKIDENSGPRRDEPSSKAWLYHSHVRGDEDANLGLVGCIIVTDPTRARANGTPADVDREFASLFMIFDDSGEEEESEESEIAEARAGLLPPPKPWAQIQEAIQLGGRHSINGRLFGNLRGLDMNQGDRVRWYLFALGSEEDFHTAHWHGLTVVEENRRRTDVVELLPASMKIADMLADNPGTWLFHCHVADHMTRGMFANMTIHATNGTAVTSRNPANAFLGLRDASESLRITRADVKMTAGDDCQLLLEGECTVHQAFSVFTETFTLALGDRSVTFKPNRQGRAQTNDAVFETKNATQYGVVYGGVLKFQVGLLGKTWCDELRRVNMRIPVRLDVGKARHKATIELEAGAAR